LQLLHEAIFLFSGIFGMRLMVDALKFACEKKNIYPHIEVYVFRVWIIIMEFVGIQLSWNLRSFSCNKDEEFKLFRKYEGNFYTAIVYSVQQVMSKSEYVPKNEADETSAKTDATETDTVVVNLFNQKFSDYIEP
jgi:hypothetical protein